MIENPSVNRSLSDPMMDDIDHALGRPTDPLRETYRNRYVTEANSREAAAFDASPWWHLECRAGAAPASLVCYQVTPEGRQALADFLAEATGGVHG